MPVPKTSCNINKWTYLYQKRVVMHLTEYATSCPLTASFLLISLLNAVVTCSATQFSPVLRYPSQHQCLSSMQSTITPPLNYSLSFSESLILPIILPTFPVQYGALRCLAIATMTSRTNVQLLFQLHSLISDSLLPLLVFPPDIFISFPETPAYTLSPSCMYCYALYQFYLPACNPSASFLL